MRRTPWLLIALLSVVSLRCGSVSGPAPVRHIVMFDRTGAPIDPTGNVCAKNVYPCHGKYSAVRDFPRLTAAQYAEYVDEILRGIDAHPPDAASGKKRILVYIHGGLNTQLSTIDRAVRTVGTISRESTFYPIFINWQSSLITSYGNQLLSIRQGRDWRWKPFGWVLAPVYFAQHLMRTVVRAPAVDVFMFRSDWQSTKVGEAAESRMSTLSRQRASSPGPPAKLSTIEFARGEDLRTNMEMRKYFIAYLLTLPFKMVGAPIIDGFGASAWQGMERASATIFRTDEGTFLKNTPVLLPNVTDSGTNGGLDVFLRRLQQYMRDHGGNARFDVVLVGHSMGTIVLNEILRTYPDMPVSSIVYMAAACSVEDYEESAVRFLSRPEHQDTQLYHLVLHYAAELRDRETMKLAGSLDLPPRGSLLVWIDNYLSSPRYYRDLTAGRVVNLVAALDDLDQVDAQVLSRIHVREFSVGGKYAKTDPQHHGDFGSMAFWLDDCWTPHPEKPERCYR